MKTPLLQEPWVVQKTALRLAQILFSGGPANEHALEPWRLYVQKPQAPFRASCYGSNHDNVLSGAKLLNVSPQAFFIRACSRNPRGAAAFQALFFSCVLGCLLKMPTSEDAWACKRTSTDNCSTIVSPSAWSILVTKQRRTLCEPQATVGALQTCVCRKPLATLLFPHQQILFLLCLPEG